MLQERQREFHDLQCTQKSPIYTSSNPLNFPNYIRFLNTQDTIPLSKWQSIFLFPKFLHHLTFTCQIIFAYALKFIDKTSFLILIDLSYWTVAWLEREDRQLLLGWAMCEEKIKQKQKTGPLLEEGGTG